MASFRSIEPIIFYKYAGYKDFDPGDYPFVIKYSNVLDLFFKLVKFKPDLIFGHDPFFLRVFFLNFICWIYAKLFRKKYVAVALENIDTNVKYGMADLFMHPFYSIYINSADLIIVLNKDASAMVKRYSKSHKEIFNFPYGIWGVDVKEFSPDRKPEDPVLASNSVFFVGRFFEGKGIDYLMPAMKNLRKQIKDAQLYMAGDGPMKDDILNLKEDWIHYLGSLENSALPGYFRAAKVTCVPSVTTKKWAEQIGMVNIQSIACGTPVVSTTSGSIPEYIPDDVGILVEERNVDELSNALISLLSDNVMNKKLGLNGRKLVLEKYDARANVAKMEKIILEWYANSDNLS